MKPKRPLPAHLEKYKFAKGHKRAKPAAAAAAAPGTVTPPASEKTDWSKFWS